jgi:DNA (cytosine-5)-methyltransferase 1
VSAPQAPEDGPVVIDLCCKAGGFSAGLARAGFRPVGIDVDPQPRYPYEFVRADVTRIDLAQAARVFGAVAVVGSPPCKLHTPLATVARITATRWEHVDLIPHVRATMRATGLPYVIENVEGARRHLVDPVTLCGTEFDLRTVDQDGDERWLKRHRLFEASFPVGRRGACDRCSGRSSTRRIGGVYGHGGGGPRSAVARDGRRRNGYQFGADQGRAVLECPWMTRDETAQAVPPAYGEWIGRQLMTHLTK